jgi:hypothetical protein
MNGLIEHLNRLGFHRNTIVETILTTRNNDRTLNAAPMGIKRIGNIFLEIKPFKSSQTFCNLSKGVKTCINISFNPMLFLATAFKEKIIEQPDIDSDLKILGTDASVFCKVVSLKDFSEIQAQAKLEVESLELWSPHPIVFSRGKAMAIEAVIHATRVEAFRNSIESEVYLGKMKDCFDIIVRVSSENSSEVMVVKKLKEIVREWGYRI